MLSMPLDLPMKPIQMLSYDYGSADGPKRDAIYALVKGLLDKGLRVDGVGMQGHWDLHYPSIGAIRAALDLYSSLGVKVHISELDVSVFSWNDRTNPYRTGLPPAVGKQLANRYGAIFRLCIEYAPVIERVTFWGVKDSNSWKNDFPVPNRRDFPLLFDEQGNQNPSFWAIVDQKAQGGVGQ